MDAAIRSTFVYYYRGASKTLIFFFYSWVYIFLDYIDLQSKITYLCWYNFLLEIQLFRNFQQILI